MAMGPAPIPPKIRFLSKFEKANNGCWEWTGARYVDGYGLFYKVCKQPMRAHRFSYELYKGPIPPGSIILHSCDNRKCVNPDHLSCGDHEENRRQMYERGRGPRGERHGMAKLRDQDVIEIRERKLSQRQLAAKFGVAVENIKRIQWGKTWRHVKPPS